jgi:coenzyme F420-reducing hydrogenase gamma subunit
MRPRVAVWKFASCDGCQLTLLDCEDELLTVAERVDLAYFLEAGIVDVGGADAPGPYDLSLVEGSITTEDDLARIRHVRSVSRTLVTIGACATAGGVQALRNAADVGEYLSIVYAQPAYIDTLARSTPIAAHVPVDVEVRGCPVTKAQLLEVISATLARRRPVLPSHSVCVDCKARGATCVLVADGQPCLGPVTHAGCGALCPSYRRGCYGCFGPAETPNMPSLTARLEELGTTSTAAVRLLRTFNAWAEPFRDESERLAGAASDGGGTP